MIDRKLILVADAVLTMDDANSVLHDGAVLVEGGRIAAIGPAAELSAANPGVETRVLRNAVLMPGLVNAHVHSGFLRGTAEHLPVWDWLTQHINPMHRVLQPHEAEAASWLCYAESLLSGTTTVVDMWRFMDGSAKAASSIGNRLVAVPYVGEHPDYNYFDTLDMNQAIIESWHRKADGRINVWVGLEHPFYSDDAGHRRAIEMSKRYKTGFHTHCSEARIEVDGFVQRYGTRPMFVLDDIGFFDTPITMIAHGVWLDPDEIRLIAGKRVSVAHNPVSNMKLASGIANVREMLDAGVPVSIGTDGEKENNNFDMFEEMKVASLLGKLRYDAVQPLDSWEVLRMGTVLGARAIGLDHEIGSLEPGKRADIIAMRTNTPRMTPFFSEGPYFNLHHNIVHAVRGSDVALTMVDGKIVVDDGVLLTADLQEIIAEVHRVAPGLFARRAAFLAANGGDMVQWTTGSPA
ncbi:amidohydrolase [Mesorhizobium sp. BAC0120]|uniref:amidohydrolase family protein n=1 Tax=Mesorhizobium sp. BAC0120 TaxID=3090670 RepID=UPI00298D4EA5|nr:amidohydrolase [Mesorhizobium sp. BAC0120]MDW6023190.1 amidohydrolase [Mesorhizobium sp. BAC0120]